MWERIPLELRRYLWIEGRSTRREWWQIEGVAIASYWFVGTGAGVLAELNGEPTLLPLQVRMVLGALMVWINFASTVRRLHDRNKSGWWGLLYLFPIFGIVWHFIECGLLPPRNQANRYGPPAPASQSPFDQIAAFAQQALTPAAPRSTTQQPKMPAAPRLSHQRTRRATHTHDRPRCGFRRQPHALAEQAHLRHRGSGRDRPARHDLADTAGDAGGGHGGCAGVCEVDESGAAFRADCISRRIPPGQWVHQPPLWGHMTFFAASDAARPPICHQRALRK